MVLYHPLLNAWDVLKLKSLVCDALVYSVTPFNERLIVTGEIRFVKRKGRLATVQFLYCYVGIKKARFVSMDRPLEITTYAGLNQNRYGYGVSLLYGKVYVYGGYDSDYQTFSSIEVLDEQTQVWQTVESTMAAPRSFLTAIGTFNSSAYVLV